jgi:hypothetical protein
MKKAVLGKKFAYLTKNKSQEVNKKQSLNEDKALSEHNLPHIWQNKISFPEQNEVKLSILTI